MNQKNNKANLLKKIQFGNPLINLGLQSLYDKYQNSFTDEEIANVYNHILNCVEGSTTAENMVYSMIAFSTCKDRNPVYQLMINTINDEN